MPWPMSLALDGRVGMEKNMVINRGINISRYRKNRTRRETVPNAEKQSPVLRSSSC